MSRRHMTRIDNSGVTCNDFKSFEIRSNMASESTSADIEGSVFQVLEGVVYYMDPTTSSNAMNVFVGSKERVRIPLSGKHCSLQAFVKHVVEHASLREEAQKRGLGSSIDIKLCRLEKGSDGNRAYAINTQAQWDEERSKFSNRGMVLQGSSYYSNYRHSLFQALG